MKLRMKLRTINRFLRWTGWRLYVGVDIENAYNNLPMDPTQIGLKKLDKDGIKMKVFNKFTNVLIGEFEISPGANLSGAYLRSANLSGAYLSGADLRSAYLRSADLRSADLRSADLRSADLQSANLRSANLSGANLSGADLRNANLSDANLSGADLSGANLRSVDLQSADLRSVDLRSANLSGADLSGADLRSANLPKFQIPQTKSLIVWKKLSNNLLCKLRIPSRAKRTASLVGNKCRAERAFVEEIFHVTTLEKKTEGFSMHDASFRYEVGKQVSVSNFDAGIRVECTTGIHFFMNRKDAESY